MADKMMRVAGRGADGLAKPLEVNTAGGLRTNTISATRTASRQGQLAAGADETIIAVTKEIELLSLVFVQAVPDSSLFRMGISFWDGTAWKPHQIPWSASGLSGSLRYNIAQFDPLFERAEQGSIYAMKLKQPIRVRGLQVKLVNGLATGADVAFSAVWNEF